MTMLRDSGEAQRDQHATTEPPRPKAAARPARAILPSERSQRSALNKTRGKALLIDFNNFSTFPTYAIGILVASLRNAGFVADVLVPLAHHAPAAVRERRETLQDHIVRRFRFAAWPPFDAVRSVFKSAYRTMSERADPRMLQEALTALDRRPDVLLLSAYTHHYDSVHALGVRARQLGVPMLVGGSIFNLPGVAEAWRSVPGLTAIVGAECDLTIPAIVETAIGGGDLLAFDGVTLPDGRRSPPAKPLLALDDAPVPDYSDFPWDRYPHRVIPLMAGRGCQWGRCVFCSDVVTASGLGFRARSLDSLMHEMREQSRRHATRDFIFLDIKLNSHPGLFRGIAETVQRHVPGAQWIGAVHVDRRKDNGLSRRDLKAAAAGGMRRISFGLESASQRLLDAMDKGCEVEANGEFVRNASEAGISVRATMIIGHPSETPDDLDMTARFLEKHEKHMDRIRLSRFTMMEGTPFYDRKRDDPGYEPAMRVTKWDGRHGNARHEIKTLNSPSHRRAKRRLLAAVHAINRQEVRSSARVFDGMM